MLLPGMGKDWEMARKENGDRVGFCALSKEVWCWIFWIHVVVRCECYEVVPAPDHSSSSFQVLQHTPAVPALDRHGKGKGDVKGTATDLE